MGDGGPAFPRPDAVEGPNSDGSYGVACTNGMSLRDYFAGQALAGICASGIMANRDNLEKAARDAYGYADAILIEREDTG